jgi:GNAT superfamily N-acetyltransferase
VSADIPNGGIPSAGIPSSEIVVRRAAPADQPAVLTLLADSLGWDRDAAFAEFFEWKHLQSPFGPSPAWIAVAGDDIVGFRTFLRWRFEHPDGRIRHAVRAVDTATAPAFQGRGIFRRLTMTAVDAFTADGVDFVFNTPNANSRPGYLRMGWSTVGRLPLVVRVAGVSSALRMRASRVPAQRWPVETTAGTEAGTLLADARVADLLAAVGAPRGFRTARTPDFLRWRYGLPALGYRAIAIDDNPARGLAVFRLRRRGEAVEAGVSDVLVPLGSHAARRELLRRIARDTGADYGIRISGTRRVGPDAGYIPFPRQGPVLTWRPLADSSAPPALRDLDLVLGDVELL